MKQNEYAVVYCLLNNKCSDRNTIFKLPYTIQYDIIPVIK